MYCMHVLNRRRMYSKIENKMDIHLGIDLCWKSIYQYYAFETVLKTKPMYYTQNYAFKKLR